MNIQAPDIFLWNRILEGSTLQVNVLVCRICGSQSGGYEQLYLLGYNVV
jgi:hypothetical protein